MYSLRLTCVETVIVCSSGQRWRACIEAFYYPSNHI
nr:MAG TPA_asm: hypothetical protein [Caudoviricetes sp.]DAW02695.1 MAG TPA: hypothetical protein [Caudoviricetes sp.]